MDIGAAADRDATPGVATQVRGLHLGELAQLLSFFFKFCAVTHLGMFSSPEKDINELCMLID